MEQNLNIRIGADTSQLSRGMDSASRELQKLNTLVRQAGTTMNDAFTPQQLKGIKDYKNGLVQNQKQMAQFKLQQMAVQGEFMNLANASDKYKGNTKGLMAEINRLGTMDKKVKESMIANDKRAQASFYQSVGAIMARSTQSSAVMENFTRMKNPLYSVNKPLLAISGGLENIAKKGQPAVLALKLLGANASMKDIQKMQRMITAGQMRFNSVLLAGTVVSALFYGALHKGAMKSSKAYAQAFKDMGKAVKKAFEPMVQVFTAVMIPVFKFIKSIADLVIQFNEAHPTIAKMIQGFLLLLPALVTLLSPLAVGIGLVAGFQAALASVAPLIMPLITGLATMAGTVAIVAGAIVLAGYVIYKNWDKIKGFLLPIFTAIKDTAVNSFNTMKNLVIKAVNAVVDFAVPVWNKISSAVKSMYNSAKPVLDMFSGYVTKAFKAMSDSTSGNLSILTAIVSGAWGIIKQVINLAVDNILPKVTSGFDKMMKVVQLVMPIIANFVSQGWNKVKAVTDVVLPIIENAITKSFGAIKNFIVAIMPTIQGIVGTAWSIISQIISVVVKNIVPIVVNAFNSIKNAITVVMPYIMTAIKVGWETISKVVTKILPVIATVINGAWRGIKAVIDLVMPAIVSLITTGFDLVKKVVSTVAPYFKLAFEGIKTVVMTVLPYVVQYVTTAFTAIKNFIVKIMPTIKEIIKVGWEFIQALVNTVMTKIVPQIVNGFNSIMKVIETVMPYVKTIVTTAWNAIKKIFDVVMPAILAIVKSVWNGIKTVITVALDIIKDVIKVATNLIKGDWSGAWKAIKQLLATVWDGIKKIISSAFNIVKTIVSSGLKVIKDVMNSVWNWIKEKISSIWNSIKNTISNAINSVINKVKSGFSSVKNNISNLMTSAKNKVSELWNSIKQKFSDTISSITTRVSNFKSSISGKFSEIKTAVVDKVRTMASDMKSKFTGGINDMVSKAKEIPGKIGASIKNAVGNAVDGVKSLGNKIIDTFKSTLGIKSPSRVFTTLGQHVINGLKNGLSKDNIKNFATGIFGGVTDGAVKSWKDLKSTFSGMSMKDIKSGLSSVGGNLKDFFLGGGDASVVKAGSGVKQWTNMAKKALMMTGQYTPANLQRMLYQMQTESGGNARAINNWDINAKRGTPSKGLMQVIDPTFRSYAMKGYNSNVYDPLSNMLASIRYAVSRYGTLGNAYKGKGYATGGIFKGTKGGSMINMAENHGDEAVLPLSNKSRMRPFANAVAEMMPNEEAQVTSEGGTYIIEVPVMIDGREVARTTAKFTKEELEKIEQKQKRMRGN